MKRIKEYYTLLQTDCSGKIADLINTRYAHSLFRRNGFHRYADADGEFIAHLLRVEPDGRFILEDQTGKERGYLRKYNIFLKVQGLKAQLKVSINLLSLLSLLK